MTLPMQVQWTFRLHWAPNLRCIYINDRIQTMLSISQIAFSRWSPYSILKSSVIAVEEESDLSSPLLGVVFGGNVPTITTQTKHNCPGHFGSIRLTEPVYHISWIPHLLRLLKKHDGKFTWDKQKATILRNGELFPASELFGLSFILCHLLYFLCLLLMCDPLYS